MKKTPLKRKKGLKHDIGAPLKKKRATGQIEGNKRKVRARLPSLKKLRDKADGFLTPLAKKQNPNCESCEQPTQVGHHWIEKSRSSYLRYQLRNIISLCNSCHAKIHNRFGNSVVGGLDVAEIIIKKRGREWKEQLDKDQPKYQKVNREFYTENIERLQKLFENEVKKYD